MLSRGKYSHDILLPSNKGYGGVIPIGDVPSSISLYLVGTIEVNFSMCLGFDLGIVHEEDFVVNISWDSSNSIVDGVSHSMDDSTMGVSSPYKIGGGHYGLRPLYSSQDS